MTLMVHRPVLGDGSISRSAAPPCCPTLPPRSRRSRGHSLLNVRQDAIACGEEVLFLGMRNKHSAIESAKIRWLKGEPTLMLGKVVTFDGVEGGRYEVRRSNGGEAVPKEMAMEMEMEMVVGVGVARGKGGKRGSSALSIDVKISEAFVCRLPCGGISGRASEWSSGGMNDGIPFRPVPFRSMTTHAPFGLSRRTGRATKSAGVLRGIDGTH